MVFRYMVDMLAPLICWAQTNEILMTPRSQLATKISNVPLRATKGSRR